MSFDMPDVTEHSVRSAASALVANIGLKSDSTTERRKIFCPSTLD